MAHNLAIVLADTVESSGEINILIDSKRPFSTQMVGTIKALCGQAYIKSALLCLIFHNYWITEDYFKSWQRRRE